MTPRRLATTALALGLALALLELVDARAMTGALAGSPVDAPLLGLLYVAVWLACTLLGPPLLLAAGLLQAVTAVRRRRARCGPPAGPRRSAASPTCCR